jgi:tetratricopeptide (TPR) repeat protein
MNRYTGLMLNFGIAFAIAYFLMCSPAYSLDTSNPQMTAEDFFKLGIEKMFHSDYQQAVENFTQAIESKRDFAAAYSNRCLAYLQLEDYQNAIADCNQALDFAPNDVEAYLNRGLAYYRQGDYQAVIADNNQVIALKPYDFRAYYNRGLAKAMLGDYLQAISDYNLALAQIPQTFNLLLADIYNDRGVARLQLEDFTAAMGDFSKAIRFNSHDYRAYYNHGCICGKIGYYYCAVRDFTESLKLYPNGKAYLNRGMTYYFIGEEEAAISDLQKALNFFTQQGEIDAQEQILDFLKNLRHQLPLLS